MNIAIIEDEIQTAWDIRNCIETLRPHFRVVTTLDSVEVAIEWLAKNPSPDLIISDIQLGDGLSFEIFKKADLKSPIIFCTAFNEYAIQAFESNGIDYILKPINEKLFERSILKVESIINHLSPRYDMDGLEKMIRSLSQREQKYKSSFLVSYRNQLIPVEIQDIGLFKYQEGFTELITTDSQRYTLTKSLDALEAQLDPTQFYRANRQFIIAYKSVKRIEHYDDRKLLLKLEPATNEQVVISKAKASAFLSWMEER
jgi:DNA-binding LytR/AlgR family response regulator